MDNDNYVIFKGGRNGIIILLDKNIDFGTLKNQLQKKVEDAQKFFGKSKSTITFKGRELSEQEEKECIDIITSNSNLNITYVYNDTNYSNVLQNKEILNPSITSTKFHIGTVRSGQSIYFEGSIVVIGDVNPGGQIIADGNIIIVGTLKGTVHAGYKGRTDVFVVALRLAPVQLRIANIITYFPDKLIKPRKRVPEFARIQNEIICVEPISCHL